LLEAAPSSHRYQSSCFPQLKYFSRL
jgi:hypothetical protein